MFTNFYIFFDLFVIARVDCTLGCSDRLLEGSMAAPGTSTRGTLAHRQGPAKLKLARLAA